MTTKAAIDRFLNDNYSRELTTIRGVFCVSNMTDTEVRQSVLVDLMNFHFWEKVNKVTLCVSFNELVRHVKLSEHSRVREQLSHPDISGRIVVDTEKDHITIVATCENLQSCMDYAGVWFPGYNPPARILENLVSLSAKEEA